MGMRQRVSYFINHRFVRDALSLQAGNVAGTLVQAVAGVVVARLLRPELFGEYSIAFSVASIVTIFLGAGVQDAVAPQVARAWATDDDDSLRRALGFWAKFTTANIVATVVVVVLLPTIAGYIYHDGAIGTYAGVIALASLISTTVFTLAQLMLQIVGRIRTLSLLTLADVVARYGAMLGFIALGWGVLGAVTGHVVGAGVLLVASGVVYERLNRRFSRLPGLGEVVGLAHRTPWKPLLRPTLWVMVDRNLGMLYGALPVALVGAYAPTTEVAYFKLAFGYMILAMSTLGPVSTLLNVHFPTVQATDTGKLRGNFIRVTIYSTLLTTAITGVVMFLSPWVFTLLYGALYQPALQYVYGFAIFGALFGLGVGLGPLWRALDRVGTSIIINLVTLGLGVPLGIFAIIHWHVWGAVGMVTAWYTLSHLVSFLYLSHALRVEISPRVR